MLIFFKFKLAADTPVVLLQGIAILSLLEEHVSLLFALEKNDVDLDVILSSPFLPLPHLSSSFSGRGAPQPFQIFQGFCKTRQPSENEIKPFELTRT